MPENSDWTSALRTSHDRLAGLLADLGPDGVTRPSYADEWTVADTVSHLGSQAEIFGAFLEAGLAGEDAPGGDSFPPIWDRWNAMGPEQQADESTAANEALVTRVEGLSAEELASYSLDLFGNRADFGGFAAMRLSEHALHTWDVAVVVDDGASVAPDAVDLLADALPGTAARTIKAVEGAGVVAVETTDPERRYVLDLGAGTVLDGDAEARDTVAMPAEAFVRLVYGRLDADHTPSGVDADAGLLDRLRAAFPGF
ncbi:MAG: hypothetical protein JWN22_996 [Nocardioides sp.]|jgi:uncharacterized protein (TIGR03083 family)|nr:hypothetical protein [Nocardioides sp.]